MQPKISLCMTTRGKNWLLERAIPWWLQQAMPRDEWELVVIDDCSEEPIAPLLEPLREAGLQVTTERLEHSDGWRGITVGMMRAFALARGEIIAETNSHLLLPPPSVELLYRLHFEPELRRELCRSQSVEDYLLDAPERTWVTLRPSMMNTELTEKMDAFPWRTDLLSMADAPEMQNEWAQLWYPKYGRVYGSHLICSIRKRLFEQLAPWPEEGFKDYGTDDPAYAGARRRSNVVDLNVYPVSLMPWHMAHNNHLQDCMELIPSKLNRNGHTARTAKLWDRAEDREQFPGLQEVVEFWEKGERTTDWRVRKAFGYPTPEPEDYIARAKAYLAQGKTLIAEL